MSEQTGVEYGLALALHYAVIAQLTAGGDIWARRYITQLYQ